MRQVSRTGYMRSLRAAECITDPAVEQMLAVCPHLTMGQVLEGLMGEGGGHIALPPVLIRGAFQTASYTRGYPEHTVPAGFRAGGRGGRTPESYATGQHVDSSPHYRFVREAIVYAEEHWDEHLIRDTWVGFVTVLVQDPTDLAEGAFDSSPKTKRTVAVGLACSWGELTGNRRQPEVDRWNGAITVATVDPLEGSEIKGDRAGFTLFNCARCGGGLDQTFCHGCGVRYPEGDVRFPGWSTPLPPKLVELLQADGHRFEPNPHRPLRPQSTA